MRQLIAENLGVFWLLTITAVVIVFSAVTGYRSVDAPPTHVCGDCGTKRNGVTRGRAGWTFLFFPLNMLLAEKRTQPCPKCGGRLIPLDSPKGRTL